jgi:hypothetical protein
MNLQQTLQHFLLTFYLEKYQKKLKLLFQEKGEMNLLENCHAVGLGPAVHRAALHAALEVATASPFEPVEQKKKHLPPVRLAVS